MGPAAAVPLDSHELSGRAALHRVGRLRFPVFELVQDGVVLAALGRAGWFKLFLGRGQRVELADGTRWRLTAVGRHGGICPAILDASRRKIAISSIAEGGYGINGKAYGLFLFGADKRTMSRPDRWILRRHDVEVAEVTRYPAAIETVEPVHLGAVLLSFTLIRQGIVGESRPRLKANWD